MLERRVSVVIRVALQLLEALTEGECLRRFGLFVKYGDGISARLLDGVLLQSGQKRFRPLRRHDQLLAARGHGYATL